MGSMLHTTSFLLISKSNIEGEWRGAGIYSIYPSKVLHKIPKSATELTIALFSQAEMTDPFEDILIEGFSVGVDALHSASAALKGLLLIREPLRRRMYSSVNLGSRVASCRDYHSEA
jgi:hypothetical protein